MVPWTPAVRFLREVYVMGRILPPRVFHCHVSFRGGNHTNICPNFLVASSLVADGKLHPLLDDFQFVPDISGTFLRGTC